MQDIVDKNSMDKAMEMSRKVLRRNISIGPKEFIDMRVTKRLAEKLGKYDGEQKKEMDPLIMEEIRGPHGEAVHVYAESYRKGRETIGGKTKRNRVRKTRRSKRINGRK